MNNLTCDICGGKIVIQAGGIAKCETCGAEYAKERILEKVNGSLSSPATEQMPVADPVSDTATNNIVSPSSPDLPVQENAIPETPLNSSVPFEQNYETEFAATAQENTIPVQESAISETPLNSYVPFEQKIETEDSANRNTKKKKAIKISVIVTSVVAVITALVILSITYFIPLIRYKTAENKMNNGDLQEAKAILGSLGDFKNSANKYQSIIAKPKKQVVISSDGDNFIIDYVYDKSGNLLKMTSTKDGTTEYIYDKSGKLLKVTKNGETVEEYIYDKSGNITTEKHINSDGTTNSDEYVYDKSGNVTKEKHSYANGSTETYEYTYNGSGNVVKRIIYIHDNGERQDRIMVSEYIYDKSGNLIKQTSTDSDENKTVYKYTYDKSGNLLKVTRSGKTINEFVYDKSGNITKAKIGSDAYEFAYDKSGNVTKEKRINFDGTIAASYEFVYDKSGNITKEKYINSGGSTETHKYDYDKSGNQIKVTSFWEGDKATTEYVYDKSGSIVKEINTYPSGSSTVEYSDFEYFIDNSTDNMKDKNKGVKRTLGNEFVVDLSKRDVKPSKPDKPTAPSTYILPEPPEYISPKICI